MPTYAQMRDALVAATDAFRKHEITGLTAGQQLADAGWAVFPVPLGSKSDSGRDALDYRSATTDRAVFAERAAGVMMRHGCADVGVAISPARCARPFVVADFDGTEQVQRLLTAAVVEHGTDPSRWVFVHTEGKIPDRHGVTHGPGRHLYIAVDEPTDASNVYGDVARGTTGHVVVCLDTDGDREHYRVDGDVFVSARSRPWLLRPVGSTTTETVAAEPVDVTSLSPGLRDKLADITDVTDRSARFHHLVAELRRHRYTQGQAVALLEPWCRAVGKYDGRVATEVARCWGKVDDDDPASLIVPTPDAVDPLEAFWDERPALRHIHDFARARRAAPAAVLGVVLTRIVAATPPQVVLPALVGGHASLNLFVALVGDSSGGKGAAERAARDALTVAADLPPAVGAGSGEGLAHLYKKRDTKTGQCVPHPDNERQIVLLSVPEIDALTALGKERRGSTLLPQLRQAWSGEALGFAYADPNKRLTVSEHTYRLVLTVGVQPRRARPLLEDSDAGTPQRFLWLPVTDPHAPLQRPDAPAGGAPSVWRPPTLPPVDSTGRRVIQVCQTAVSAIDDNRVAALRGQADDPLAGHALLGRLKVAAALSLLDGRAEVADEDWNLAGVLQDVSDTTRRGIERQLRDEIEKKNTARAELEAKRDIVRTERTADHAEQTAGKAIRRKLQATDGWISQSQLRRSIKASHRTHFESAIDAMLASGEIESRPIESAHNGVEYRIAGGEK